MRKNIINKTLPMSVFFIIAISSISGSISATSTKNQPYDSANIIINEKSGEIQKSKVVLKSPILSEGIANSPWPMLHHDLNHTGRSEYNTSKNNGQEKWNFTASFRIRSSPVIDSNGTIYIISQDGNVYAIYPNGTQKWKYSSGSEAHSSLALDSNNTVYFGSYDNNLYALNSDGTKRWTFASDDDIFSSPAIGSDGTIYFGSKDNKLYALYPNGTKKWAYTTGDDIYSSPAVGSDGTIYFGSYDNKFYALYPNGSMKWSYTTGDNVGSSPAIGANGTIYFGSWDKNLYALFPNGTKKWSYTTGDVVWSVIALGSDESIYFSSLDWSFYALYPNGTKKWSYAAGGYVGVLSAIDSEDTVYFGDDSNCMHAFYPNGTKKWTFACESSGTFTGPAIASDGTIYVGAEDKKLYAIGSMISTAPQNLTANGTNKQVQLTWNEPEYLGAPKILKYNIFRGTTSGCETLLVKIDNSSNYLDTNVTNGQKYYYMISAVNSAGESPKSNETSAIPESVPTAPRNLATLPDNESIKLTWSTPLEDGGHPISNYSIYRNNTIITTIGSVFEFIDTGLTNGIVYSYSVSALNKVGEGPRSIPVAEYPRTIPTAPQEFNVISGHARVVLKWKIPINNGGAAIKNYNIYRGLTAGNQSFYHSIAGGISWVDTNITIGVDYYYSVSAVNIAGEGPKTAELKGTPYSIPEAPTLAATGGISNVTLSWTIPISNGAAILSYRIYRGVSPGNEKFLTERNDKGTSWIDINISVAITYYYYITAINLAGEGPKSNELTATPYSVPNAPEFSAFAGISNVSLLWTVPISNGAPIISYNIYRGTNFGTENLSVRYTVNGTYWLDTNITDGTTYYYAISAINIAGEGSSSNEQNATPFSIPDVPLLTVNSGISKVIISWTVPDSNGASILNYKIYRRSESGKDGIRINGIAGGTSWVDMDIENGVTYYYSISAVNIAGESPRSKEQNATPFKLPSAPVLTSKAGINNITLYWTVPTSIGAKILSFNIYRGNIAGKETIIIGGYMNGTTWTDFNIIDGVSYYYYVRAVNIGGEGEKSNLIKIGSLPNIPTGFNATGNNEQVVLNWVPSTFGGSVIKYNVYRSDSENGTYALISSTNETRFTDSKLTNGIQYWYKINAQNSNGFSGNTTPISATPYKPLSNNNNTSLAYYYLAVTLIVIIVAAIVTILILKKKVKRKK